MLNYLLNLIKMPVTTTDEQFENGNLKKSLINAAILSAIYAVVTLITMLITKFDYLKYYGDKIVSSTITSFITIAVVILVYTTIMYIIARILKSDNDFAKFMVISNNSVLFIVMGAVFNALVSWLYAPLGFFAMIVLSVYAGLTAIFCFRSKLAIEKEDKLILAYVCIISVMVIAGYYMFMNAFGDLFYGFF